jgi:hypothetical protein
MIALKVRKLFFFVQVAGKGGAASTIEAGIRATAQLLGEDVGKEVNIDQFSIVDQFEVSISSKRRSVRNVDQFEISNHSKWKISSKCRSVRNIDQLEVSNDSKWKISSKFRISLKCRSVRKIVISNQNFDFFQSSLKNLDGHT